MRLTNQKIFEEDIYLNNIKKEKIYNKVENFY